MKLLKSAVAATAMVAASSSFAVSFDLSVSNQSAGSNEWTRLYESDGINLSVSAYTGGDGTYNHMNVIQEEAPAYDAGLGSGYAAYPWHAVDNDGNQFDALLLTFSTAVSLDSASIGWYHNDSDISVLAYTGNGDAASSFLGKTWNQGLATDWTGTDHLNVAQQGYTADVNAAEVVSTSWLVASQFWFENLAVESDGGGAYWGKDYIKLSGVTIDVPTAETPLPGAVIFMLSGLAGFGVLRRKGKKA